MVVVKQASVVVEQSKGRGKGPKGGGGGEICRKLQQMERSYY